MVHKSEITRVNPKLMTRGDKPCLTEMLTFLASMKKNHFDDDLCAKEREALNTCVELQRRVIKQKSTINYHLARVSRLIKKLN